MLAVELLTVAVVTVHERYKNNVNKPTRLQMKTNNAYVYGVHEAGRQHEHEAGTCRLQVYDYVV